MPEPLNYQLPEGTVITPEIARGAVKCTWDMVRRVLSKEEAYKVADQLQDFFGDEMVEASGLEDNS